MSASSSSISTEVSRGTDWHSTSVVAPYPGPTSSTSSPRSVPSSAHGRMISRIVCRHSSLPHFLCASFTVAAYESSADLSAAPLKHGVPVGGDVVAGGGAHPLHGRVGLDRQPFGGLCVVDAVVGRQQRAHGVLVVA